MGKKHLTLQEALRSDEGFVAFLLQETQTDEFDESRRNIAEAPHPTDEMLYEYVLGESDETDAGFIRKHITFCKVCADDVAQIRLIEQDLEDTLSDWVGESRLHSGQDPKQAHQKVNLLEGVAMEIWEPEGAGEMLVAADASVTQEHEFDTEVGTIKLVCAWGRAVDDEPAFLWVSWEAESTTKGEFTIRLFNPETHEIRYEVRPGKRRRGERTLTSDKLGFDPSREKWVIAIIPLKTT